MHRTIILFLACLAMTAMAAAPRTWRFRVTNNAGRVFDWPVYGRRHCICLRTTQTSTIKNTDGGVMRLFGSDNCKGDFIGLALGATRTGAQWVNSASVGEDGIASTGPNDCDSPF
ncbi:hypothetical protein BG004_000280 [Podila humilis]|nr:hypothetical protein BG004_000280 [Podila humilis]